MPTMWKATLRQMLGNCRAMRNNVWTSSHGKVLESKEACYRDILKNTIHPWLIAAPLYNYYLST